MSQHEQAPPFASTAAPYDEWDAARQGLSDKRMVNTIDAFTAGNGLAWAVYLLNVAEGASLAPLEGVPAMRLHPGVLLRLEGHVVALREAYDHGDEERLASEKLDAVRTLREVMSATINHLNKHLAYEPSDDAEQLGL
jgi:hypothetical protein